LGKRGTKQRDRRYQQMSSSASYHRGYRIAFTAGAWGGRYVEIAPTRPELPILRTAKLELPWSQSESEALEEAYRRIDELLK
jgi:hypothetical protein